MKRSARRIGFPPKMVMMLRKKPKEMDTDSSLFILLVSRKMYRKIKESAPSKLELCKTYSNVK